MISLDEIKVGKACKVTKVNGDAHLKRRLFEFGILPKEEIKMLAISPLKNSALISVKNYTLALRSDILKNILVERYE